MYASLEIGRFRNAEFYFVEIGTCEYPELLSM